MRPGPSAVAGYQRRDHYHQRAKREGYRSRAAYKLAEIQRAHRLLRPGKRVVDLGCWPGGWLQVASAAVGARGRVVGIDLAAVEPLVEHANVIAIQGDLVESSVYKDILGALGGPADVVLSDAAPKLTGVRAADCAREAVLLEAIEAALPCLLRPGGSLLLKILEGPDAQRVERRIRARFERARGARPGASRKGSTERYLLARGYRGG